MAGSLFLARAVKGGQFGVTVKLIRRSVWTGGGVWAGGPWSGSVCRNME